MQDGFLSFALSLHLDRLLPAEVLAAYALASGKLILETSTIFSFINKCAASSNLSTLSVVKYLLRPWRLRRTSISGWR